MKMLNSTSIILLAEFHYYGSLRITIFFLLLVSYLITLIGNILIITTILGNRTLHTPMYFFLSNLSIVEIFVTSTVTPKFLSIIGFGNREISHWGCYFQCYFYFVLASVDFLLLAVMAFDRYVAICQPLNYVTVMNNRLCIFFTVFSWLFGFVDTLPTTIITYNIPICRPKVIDHFFCDIGPILKLACGDTSLIKLLILIASSLTVLGSLVCIAISYTLIIIAIFNIKSGGQRWKTFSTCSSHLILVFIFYSGSVLMCDHWLSGEYVLKDREKLLIPDSGLRRQRKHSLN
ncbi:olfactory receptor 6J1-like [Engystomops pustulosus]|uniref:olfactory receptor 6J1-like n=1 Tax=Engystomops pustulosus TaxID=76066 RepID=UPI003AFA70E7